MLCNIIACILDRRGGDSSIFPRRRPREARHSLRGSYRLIDLSVSNCVHSDIRQILIFPQYQTQALEDHLHQGWSFLSQGRDAYVMSVPPRREWGPGSIRARRMRCTNTSPSWNASTRRMF